MGIMAYIALLGAITCGVLRCITDKYVFSACMSLLSACAAAASGQAQLKLALVAGLLISVVADWFLAHQKGHSERFLYGVIGFFTAHCMFAWYAAMRFRFSTSVLVIALALLAIYCVYMALRMLPRVEAGLKAPLTLYMLVSIASLYCAMSMNAPAAEKALYIAGIAAILFSDTMIGENEFVGNRAARKLVLPTYYLCHALLALSALLR